MWCSSWQARSAVSLGISNWVKGGSKYLWGSEILKKGKLPGVAYNGADGPVTGTKVFSRRLPVKKSWAESVLLGV